MKQLGLLPLCLLAAFVPQRAFAADNANGVQLARSLCTNCHIVEPGGTSKREVAADVPSFMAVAAKPGQTVDKIKGYILNPHPPMPEVQLTTVQLADVAAYILSLRKPE